MQLGYAADDTWQAAFLSASQHTILEEGRACALAIRRSKRQARERAHAAKQAAGGQQGVRAQQGRGRGSATSGPGGPTASATPASAHVSSSDGRDDSFPVPPSPADTARALCQALANLLYAVGVRMRLRPSQEWLQAYFDSSLPLLPHAEPPALSQMLLGVHALTQPPGGPAAPRNLRPSRQARQQHQQRPAQGRPPLAQQGGAPPQARAEQQHQPPPPPQQQLLQVPKIWLNAVCAELEPRVPQLPAPVAKVGL